MAEQPAEESPWSLLDLPIRIHGAERTPALLRGFNFAASSVMIGALGGLALESTRQAIDPTFLVTVEGIVIGAFLALLSLMAVFSIFVHQELMRKKEVFFDTIKALNDRLQLGLLPAEYTNPRNEKAQAELDNRPPERLEWIMSHRNIQCMGALADHVRWSMERLALVTLVVVVPALVLLPLTPWIVLVNPIAVGALAYVIAFSCWAVWETIEHIFVSLKFVNDPVMVLLSVRDRSGSHWSEIAWPASESRRFH